MNTRIKRISSFLLALALLSFWHTAATPPASADPNVLIDLTGQCPGGVGDVAALVGAINTANGNGAGSDTIQLAAGCVYTLTAVDNTTTLGRNGLPVVTTAIIIQGNGSTIQRSAATDFRLLAIDTPGNLSLFDLNLTGGLARGNNGTNGRDAGGGGGGAGMGGAILLYDGTLSLERVALYGNEGRGGNGGAGGGATTPDVPGVGGDGSPAVATLRGGDGVVYGGGAGNASIFGGGGGGGACVCGGNGGAGGTSIYGGNGAAGNGTGGASGSAGGGAGGGGAIFVYNGTLNLSQTTFYNNLVAGGTRGSASAQHGKSAGAALFNYQGQVTATNVSFAQNTAGITGQTGFAGSLFNYQGQITTYNVTFGSNTIMGSQTNGQNIYNDLAGATLTLNNTIVAGANSGLVNAAGTLDVANRNNLIQTGYAGAGVVIADPLLGAWQDNGGLFPTQGLLMGSPAIDAGDNGRTNGATVDLRGFNRIAFGGVSTTVDMGAYELLDTDILVSAVGNPVIDDGEVYDYGNTVKGTPVIRTFTIANEATAVGTLIIDPDSALLTGTGFSLVNPANPFGGVTTLAPGQSTAVQIRADATADGQQNGNFSFRHNGAPELVPYDIGLTIETNTPEIEVSSNNVAVISGVSVVNFGLTTAGVPLTQTFVVTNTEQPTLVLSNPVVPANFTLLTPFPINLAPGQTTTFQIRFNAPAAPGSYIAPFSFETNDETENPFTFQVQGNVDAPPDPNIIGDAMRLSDMGGLGSTNFYGLSPDVAYNATTNRFLVVWEGTEVQNRSEIYGQFIDAATGAEVGTNDFLIMAAIDTNQTLRGPAVVWNSTRNEFLVVAYGDVTLNDRNEIYAQRLDGATGALVGNARFLVTDNLGGAGAAYDASRPDVAYNATADEYFVAWEKDKDTDNAIEIWGRRIQGNRALGDGIGNDIRLSDMGDSDTDASFDARYAKVVWNSVRNEYLVVWGGNDQGMAPFETEIFGQRVSAAGAEIGTNDFRISQAGTDGNDLYSSTTPAVTFNPTHDEYFVVWQGWPGGVLADNEGEIFGQRVSGAGAEVGTNDLRLSDVGPDGSTNYAPYSPAVVYGAYYDEYVVTWYGGDDVGTLALFEQEVFLQRVAGDRILGDEVGLNDVRLSRMGPDGNTSYNVGSPKIEVGGATSELFVVWQANSDEAGMVANEYEIFARRYQPPLSLKCGAVANQPYVFHQTTLPMTVMLTNLGTIDCLAVVPTAANHPNATSNLQTGRYWTITAENSAGNPATGFTANITLSTNGFAPTANDKVCRYTGVGQVWDCAMSSFTGTTITRNGVTQFSDWAVGQAVGPTAVTLQTVGQTPITSISFVFWFVLLLGMTGVIWLAGLFKSQD